MPWEGAPRKLARIIPRILGPMSLSDRGKVRERLAVRRLPASSYSGGIAGLSAGLSG